MGKFSEIVDNKEDRIINTYLDCNNVNEVVTLLDCTKEEIVRVLMSCGIMKDYSRM